MKKIISVVLLVAMINIIFFLTFIFLQNDQITDKSEEYIIEVEYYLKNKYGNKIKAEFLDCSTKDGFYANYHLKNLPEIRFSVCYWEGKEKYWDNLLQRLLADELKHKITKILQEHELFDCNIIVGEMVGPPFELSERLYSYYENLDAMPTISDIKNHEMFLYVSLEFGADLSHEVKDSLLNAFLQEELPVNEYIFKQK